LDTYHVVLYLHLLSLFVGIGAAPIIVVCLFRLRAADTVEQAVPWGILAGQTEKAFPVSLLGLFATGAYMTSDVWTWSTRWIDVSIAAFVVVALQGPLVAGRRAHMLKQALMENGPGALGERAKRLTRDPLLWMVSLANPGIVLGIVWNMTQKPGIGEAIAAVAVGYVVGALLAVRLTRAPAVEAAPVGEPTT
jgi:hypothetical protein